jgi:hypothetical protein
VLITNDEHNLSLGQLELFALGQLKVLSGPQNWHNLIGRALSRGPLPQPVSNLRFHCGDSELQVAGGTLCRDSEAGRMGHAKDQPRAPVQLQAESEKTTLEKLGSLVTTHNLIKTN